MELSIDPAVIRLSKAAHPIFLTHHEEQHEVVS